MKRHSQVCLSCCLLVFVAALPQGARAQNPPPQDVYVSTAVGHQILAFTTSGAVSGVCNMGATVVPEDAVVGPDGQLYVTDTTENKIFRVPTPIAQPIASPGSCNAVAIYDKANCNAANCPSAPEGPSFLRINTLDLYFNTHGSGATGTWKIPGIANSSTPACDATNGPACPAPIQVSSNNFSGEGLDFDVFGKLLAVDQANNQVLRDPVACLNGTPGAANCFASFITGLNAPVGIAVNTCGDVLVASGKLINRYTGGGSTPVDSLRFSGSSIPQFLEVDSMNRIFVVTAADETGKGGTLWRFDPPAAAPFTSCGLKSFTNPVSVAIKTSLAAGIATSNGLGLGLAASNASISLPFNATGTSQTQLYNFGAQHTFTVTCNNVSQAFNLTVTAAKSRPTDAVNQEVNFSAPQFPKTVSEQCPVPIVNADCLHYGGQHGFCTQYLEQATTTVGAAISDDTAVQPNIDSFCTAAPVSPDPLNTQNPFTFFVTYSSAEPINDPGGAHVVTGNFNNPSDVTGEAYTDCQSHQFYPQLTTGDPITMSGKNSKHVVFNADLAPNDPNSPNSGNGAISLNSPVSSCTTPINCNPQFNIGQNIAVKFSLLHTFPPFTAITNATEQVSIARVQNTTKSGKVTNEFVPQNVVATKNSATLNFFVPNNSGQYSFNVDSSFFDKLPKGTNAVYQFTIWGNGAPPFIFFTSGTF